MAATRRKKAQVHTASGVTVYTNGVVARIYGTGFGPANAASLRLGTSDNCPGGQTLGGLLDEVRIYRWALTAGEVSALYAAGSAGMCPGDPPAPVALSEALDGAGFELRFKARGEPTLALDVLPGARVVVEVSEDLRSWRTVLDLVPAQERVTLTDQEAIGRAGRFYRARFFLP